MSKEGSVFRSCQVLVLSYMYFDKNIINRLISCDTMLVRVIYSLCIGDIVEASCLLFIIHDRIYLWREQNFSCTRAQKLS